MHAARWDAGQGMIKGCVSGPGMPRCGCHAPTLFSGQSALPSPEELPAYMGLFPKEHELAGSPSRAVLQGALGLALETHTEPAWPLCAATAGAVRGAWNEGPASSAFRCGLAQGSHRSPLLPSKCLDRCSKGLIRAQIRVRPTQSITGQLFYDFSLTFFIQNAGNHLFDLWLKARLDSVISRGVVGSSGKCTLVFPTSAHPHENETSLLSLYLLFPELNVSGQLVTGEWDKYLPVRGTSGDESADQLLLSPLTSKSFLKC